MSKDKKQIETDKEFFETDNKDLGIADKKELESKETVVELATPSKLVFWKRLISIIITGAVAASIVLFRDEILLWLDQAKDVHALWIMGAATILALFPVIPYPIIGGALGLTFGPELGAVYTWVGSAAASIIMFLLLRWLFFDWGQRILKKVKVIDRMTALFERNAFLFILATRMIPFIPSIVVNAYCAASKVGFWPYALASSLGKVPAMFLFAVLGDQLLTEPRNMLISVSVYALFILVIYISYFKIYLRFSSANKR
ncbi:TVP38/TMEM64 family protein [Bacillus horti]|uniref:TVP38/TMEM64 family membrane protein n=1 Tax=Caldalkalibacillus horti TaxID=77523 RepID=A0ABT9VZQ2_9BACI|nr:TVP38/TMEM64 family protein [Bacillus horti]MDQ0166292.1 putative membrane protein YdjX (TVP38/TMEM64 family) [Bacillus horti]